MEFGEFVGDVVTEWLVQPGPDRDMKLREPFAFIDSKGVEWSAPVGSNINGASIPRVLWTLEGSPFQGDYRRASVVHDVACQKKDRPSRDAHRMFYEALRASGVPEFRAMKMYTAVRLFGPRWEDNSNNAMARALNAGSQDSGPSFAELEAAVDALFNA